MIQILLPKVKFLYGDIYAPDLVHNTYAVSFVATDEVAEVLSNIGVVPKESNSSGTTYYRASSNLRPLVSCHNLSDGMVVLEEAMNLAQVRNLPLEKAMHGLTVDLVATPFTRTRLSRTDSGLGINEIRVNAHELFMAVCQHNPHAKLFEAADSIN